MASITVRNLDEWVKQRLRVRAAANGRSMEQEVRDILRAAVDEAHSIKQRSSDYHPCTRFAPSRRRRARHSTTRCHERTAPSPAFTGKRCHDILCATKPIPVRSEGSSWANLMVRSR